MNENNQHQMTELVFMATELMIRNEAEEKKLNEKIKDEGFFDHIIKSLASLFMLMMFVLHDFYEKNGMDSKEATEKANEKAREIVFKTLQDLVDSLQ